MLAKHTEKWTCVLKLDSTRAIIDGSEQSLTHAIRNGQDLRIYTEFLHNEHIDVTSNSNERIHEVAEFRVTYVIDGRWVAGIMTLRQPVGLPDSFGTRSSMSYFLYNQDGSQAIARPHLDGESFGGTLGPSDLQESENMPKYHENDSWDADTNAPSSNFVYDFDLFRFYVSSRWDEILSHQSDGNIRSGSVTALADAFAAGCAVKVAVDGLCDDLGGQGLSHELFVETHSGYSYTRKKLFIAGTQPVVRVRPAIPMRYESENWDFGWLIVRTDGVVILRRCNPYTLAFDDRTLHCALRWFVS